MKKKIRKYLFYRQEEYKQFSRFSFIKDLGWGRRVEDPIGKLFFWLIK